MQQLLQWPSKTYWISWECVVVAFAIQRAKPMPVWFYHIFPYYLAKNANFGRKNIEHTVWVFWLFMQFCMKYFSFCEEFSLKLSKMYISLRVKFSFFFSGLNKTWIFPTDFLKTSRYQISWTSIQWEPSYFKRTGRVWQKCDISDTDSLTCDHSLFYLKSSSLCYKDSLDILAWRQEH